MTMCAHCSKTSCTCLQERVAAELASAFGDAIDAIWKNPERYNQVLHGPRLFKAASPKLKTAVIDLVSTMRLAALTHQGNHWTVSGPEFYSDHKLFERLYEESQAQIDALAEKAVSLMQVRAIELHEGLQRCMPLLNLLISLAVPGESSGLAEDHVQAAVLAVKACGQSEPLTPGLTNLLDDIYDTHESFQYLLGQRSKHP